MRAKLHKITGYVLRDTGRADEALAHLTQALQLHEGCGVKRHRAAGYGHEKQAAMPLTERAPRRAAGRQCAFKRLRRPPPPPIQRP